MGYSQASPLPETKSLPGIHSQVSELAARIGKLNAEIEVFIARISGPKPMATASDKEQREPTTLDWISICLRGIAALENQTSELQRLLS